LIHLHIYHRFAMAHSATVASVNQEVPNGPIFVDTQHEDLVHDCQLDFYGRLLATCSSGKKGPIEKISPEGSKIYSHNI
jgi:protein transport protein SEC13